MVMQGRPTPETNEQCLVNQPLILELVCRVSIFREEPLQIRLHRTNIFLPSQAMPKKFPNLDSISGWKRRFEQYPYPLGIYRAQSSTSVTMKPSLQEGTGTPLLPVGENYRIVNRFTTEESGRRYFEYQPPPSQAGKNPCLNMQKVNSRRDRPI